MGGERRKKGVEKGVEKSEDNIDSQRMKNQMMQVKCMIKKHCKGRGPAEMDEEKVKRVKWNVNWKK